MDDMSVDVSRRWAGRLALLGVVFITTLIAVSAARAHGSWFWYGTLNFLGGYTACTVIRSADDPDE